MGLYDTFYGEVICPYCGNKVDTSVQSKMLICAMKSFEVGDEVDAGRLEINQGKIRNEWTWCDNCDERFYMDIIIENGIFKGFENFRKEGDEDV